MDFMRRSFLLAWAIRYDGKQKGETLARLSHNDTGMSTALLSLMHDRFG
jgi:hypothetical protein